MFVLLALVWTVATPGFDPAQCVEVGRISKIRTIDNQPVQVRTFGSGNWTRADEGMRLCRGDEVRSRFRSRARLALDIEGRRMDVVVGVNARVQISAVEDSVFLEVVHGVVSLDPKHDWSAKGYVRAGPSMCSFGKGLVYANWDPFKREANWIAVEGEAVCHVETQALTLYPGQSIEIVAGVAGDVRPPVPMIVQAFAAAGEM